MPITQWPFAHCAFVEHVLPSGSAAHVPPWQTPL
jgi:hypothetical protein